MRALLILFALALCEVSSGQDRVIINNETLSRATVQEFQARYQIQMQNGDYWYDKLSGAWGYTGGPTVGFILPGVNVGGALRPDASNGRTGVYINGRQLHAQDLMGLQQLLGPVLPGQYWVDAHGNAGYQGGPALVNLWHVARQQKSSFYRNSYTGIGAGSSGGTSYVMGKDWSVIVGN